MPLLHQLWRTSHSHVVSQNRLKVISAGSSKRTFGFSSGEQVFHFEVSGTYWRFSKVIYSDKSLPIPEAASWTLATRSVHGRVHCNPRQALLETHQPARLKQNLGWTVASSFYGTLTAASSMCELRHHLCLPDLLPAGSSTLTITLTTFSDQKKISFFSKKAPERSGFNHDLFHPLSRAIWNSNIHGSGNWKKNVHKASQNKKISMGWPLCTSIAFHLMRWGLSLFSAVPKSLESSRPDLDGVAPSTALQLGAILDSSTDKCNLELAENHSEGALSSSGLQLLSAACCMPHPEKLGTGGEDAYFICPDNHVIGVADGVGGWADMGIDAGEYARQLMNQSLIAAQQEPAGCIDTVRVMATAHSKTTCRGSSTACILALSDYGLQAANLGDSGFLVVRNDRLIFKSPPQQHNFNFPFQLENGGGDPPDAAQVFTVEVAVGDVVVAGTDGLFDNLYDKDIVSLVVQATRSGSSPDITAKKIVSLARERAQDHDRQTPFSAAAQDAGFRFYGGKMDDITVVVSYVVK